MSFIEKSQPREREDDSDIARTFMAEAADLRARHKKVSLSERAHRLFMADRLRREDERDAIIAKEQLIHSLGSIIEDLRHTRTSLFRHSDYAAMDACHHDLAEILKREGMGTTTSSFPSNGMTGD